MKNLPWRECGWAILVLLLLAVLYVGSYLALLGNGFQVHDNVVLPSFHLVSEGPARSFFSLAFRCDKAIRPQRWDPAAVTIGSPSIRWSESIKVD